MKLDKNSKIAVVGNLAQNGYILAKALRNKGYQTDLYVTSKNNEMSFDQSPYEYENSKANISWVKIFKTKPPLKAFLKGKKIFKAYDWIIAITLSPAYVQFFNKNFVCIATGADLREFAFEKGMYNWLLKRAYKKNKHLFFGNHDLEPQVKLLGLEKRSSQFPGPIEISRYEISFKKPGRDYLLIFWPTNWSHIKGSDKFMAAMDYIFQKNYPVKLKLINRLKVFGLSNAETEEVVNVIEKNRDRIVVAEPIKDKDVLIQTYLP